MDIAGDAAGYDSVTIERLQRQLLIVMLKFLPLAIVLTLLGCFGVNVLADSIGIGAPLGMALGWIIGGYGAALGTFAICAAALRARSAVGTRAAVLGRAIRVTRYSRLLILLSAVSAEIASIVGAPVGMDRNFVLWVNGIIAACLALFALTADDVGRAIRQFDGWIAARSDRRSQRRGDATGSGENDG